MDCRSSSFAGTAQPTQRPADRHLRAQDAAPVRITFDRRATQFDDHRNRQARRVAHLSGRNGSGNHAGFTRGDETGTGTSRAKRQHGACAHGRDPFSLQAGYYSRKARRQSNHRHHKC